MPHALSVAVAVLGLCGQGCVNDSGNTSVLCAPISVTSAQRVAGFEGSIITIVMENHSRGDILGNPDAPFINGLASDYAIAAGYHDAYVHPSEANYLWMVAGENFGVLDDDDPSSHHLDSRSHVADQLDLTGLSWKAYEESMGAPCVLTSQGRYAVRHDPFVYFDDVNGWGGRAFATSQRCTDHVVDYTQLGVDLAGDSLPAYVFITPNLDHDMHDGSIADGDAWLSAEVPSLLASEAFTRGGVLFLMWDEGGDRIAGDDPPMIVVSPHAKHSFVSQVDYDTSSYLKTVQLILGLEPLPCGMAASTAAMEDLFDRPIR